jgi:Ca2+-dependent lipid-binding protein
LGSVELLVSELAQRSDSREYPYESTGAKSAADLLTLDTSDERKGTLHYVAEFLPALALRGVKFEERPNELQRATNDDGNGEDVIVAVDETPPVPEGITALRPVGASVKEKKQGNSNSASTTEASSIHTAHTSVETEPVQELTEISREELLHRQSGVIVFNVLSGKLAKKARVEVLLDNGYWPAFATAKSRSTSARWDHVGEGFVKELDFSQVWLRLDESINDERDDIIAEYKGGAKEFLEATLVCEPLWICSMAELILLALGWSSHLYPHA